MFSFRYSPSECVLTEKYVYNINKTKSLLDAIFLSLILQSLLLLCLILQRLILLSLIQNADLPNFQLLHHPLQYFNVHSMSIQCLCNVQYIQYIFNSIYIQCLAIYWLFAVMILTDSLTPNLEILSHLKILILDTHFKI